MIESKKSRKFIYKFFIIRL